MPETGDAPGTTRAAGGTAAHSGARRALLAGALFGATGVVAGAFGAHALRTRLAPEVLAVFETAARYQLLHALALVAAATAARLWPGRWAAAAAWLLGSGILLFSGSLYLLVFTGERLFGAITPLGGLLLILGWLALAMAALRSRD
jgi:uncharacterized membrane protein YgdD (TMEM256/DUF423 family)